MILQEPHSLWDVARTLLEKIISMKEWKEKLEVFLKINEYNILKDNGKIKREIADKLALDEYKKYRVKYMLSK